ncbi:hypothetical protein EUTSA_v10022213mg [Eutrema salsugineum]|uniref:Uncharacterized protein n=1 Tax=Eutrema salsugineum TaxID=72664 RepID=V4LGH4_EUTSA|nr:hypothetical protein EUTSA_v10022213mg [Eutrema salsugineum]
MRSLRGTSKFILVAILITCVFISNKNVYIASGYNIGYPVIGRDNQPCSPKYPATCRPKEQPNPYTPGCEVETRCKRPPAAPQSKNTL